MKKLLLLFCITALTSHAFANFINQRNWRWRKDDGSETSATYLAAENTAPTITSSDNIRLRIELYNPQTGKLPLNNTTLAYSTTGNDGTWILISDTVVNRDFVLSKSPFVTSFEATTHQITLEADYTFQPGKIIDSKAPFKDSLAPKVGTEYEWVIKPTASAKLNSTYYFETSVLGYNKPLPTLMIGSVLPVTLTNFSVSANNSKALVKWTTANEVNNDRFDVLRSANGQAWQAIASVQAKGNGGTAQNNYEFTDNTPLSGDSYYRLKQYNKDGSATLSEVKNFSLKDIKSLIASVYPNPTTAAINVTIKDYSGSVTATVTNTQGAVVHREVFMATTAAANYKLNLNRKLPSGTYYVNLSGNNLAQKLKVIVQ